MSLASDIAAVLPELRAQANARMTETIRAGKITDSTDETTGDPIQTVGDVIYEGPARVKYTSNAVSTDDSSSQVFTSQVIVVSVPTGSVVLPGGTAVEVLTSTSDDALVGRKYTVDGVPAMGQTTVHRYSVTELD